MRVILKAESIHVLGRQKKAEQIYSNEEAAGNQEVHHVQSRSTPEDDLIKDKSNLTNFN